MIFDQTKNFSLSEFLIISNFINYNRLKIIISNYYISISLNDENYIFQILNNTHSLVFFSNPVNNFSQILFFYNNNLLKTFNINNNYYFDPNFSSFQCNNISTFNVICNFTNVCLKNSEIIFFSPYNLFFNLTYLIPSSRLPPFISNNILFFTKNLKIEHNIKIFDKNKWIFNKSIIGSRIFNNQMIWHNIMDFIVPFYKTLSFFNLLNESIDFYLYDNFGKYGLYYIKPLVNNTIINLYEKKKFLCFKDVIFGLYKYPIYNNKDIINISYNFQKNELILFRNFYFKKINYSKCFTNLTNPKIVFINRKDKRIILNLLELVNLTRSICPYCIIEIINLEDLTKLNQISYICNTSILIGTHGSGLTHSIWMEKNTYLIEILPYKYECRNWYEILTNSININYYKINSKFINNNINQSKFLKCFNEKNQCFKPKCHDFLRDQSVIVELNYFIQILNTILKSFLLDQ